MADIKSLLLRAAEITRSKIAFISQNESIAYPEDADMGISYGEACRKAGKNYKGYNIYICDITGAKAFVCVGADKYYESETTKLTVLLLSSALESDASTAVRFVKAVEGKYDAAELVRLEEGLRDCIPGYMLLVEGYGDSEGDVLEILTNTMEVRISHKHDNRIIAVADEENITEACSSFIKNVLSELLLECRIVIGGYASRAEELHGLYRNCMEALCLKHIYGLGDSLLNYDGMYGYRIAYSLEPKLKEFIKDKVFTAELKDMVSGELGITIEEFFKNNLNLTDTAAKLYIHRNTLLYRLDKVHKSTGFDLKRFEDSWLFKLAWMLYKENSK